MYEDTPTRAPGRKQGRRGRDQQTHEDVVERNERRQDPQDQHTDEQEPIRQQNRYDPGQRRPL
jgi:hypothetical protein